MPPFNNLLRKRFGRLVVESLQPKKKKYGHNQWLCRCDCGNIKIIDQGNLTNGNTLSCGCLHHDIMLQRNTKHGKCRSPTHISWSAMKQRCYNKDNQNYKYYGGRGVRVCKRWRNSFENFLEDMGTRPEGMTLERIDNEKGYSLDNCRWATMVDQNKNKRDTVYINFKGKVYIQSDFANYVGISSKTVSKRLKQKWPPSVIYNYYTGILARSRKQSLTTSYGE